MCVGGSVISLGLLKKINSILLVSMLRPALASHSAHVEYPVCIVVSILSQLRLHAKIAPSSMYSG